MRKTMTRKFSYILLLCIFCWVGPQRALAKGTVVDSSSTNVPTAFAASSGSQVMACQGNVVEIANYTAAPLAVGFGSLTAVPPFDYAYVPTGSGSGSTAAGTARFKPKGGVDLYVYLRTVHGSAASAGLVLVSCYNEEKP